ncbi:MAG: hypothetical protein CMI90_01580 [Pelagibacteraceae bacterium]|nr:hypothetical protein [Pelagibacteraceae bacterium]|tara:strand:+ start:124 stop:885 length:762 start_codon:yes stop_codon:yes gene_type:complete
MIKRIIPLLLYKDGRLVKGINYQNYRDVGSTSSSIKIYNNQLADELMLINISERHSETQLFFNEVVKKSAQNCFIPLTTGGKITELKHIEKLLKSGSDKVLITSKIVEDINFLTSASRNFGSQCIVVGVEYRFYNNDFFITFNNSKNKTDILLKEYIKKVADNGAGEIVLFDIENDGIMKGASIKNLKDWSELINLPIIHSGGIGNFKHILDIFQKTKINGVACGSLFNFGDNTPIRARSYLQNNSFPVRTAR